MNAEIKFLLLWAVIIIPFFAGSVLRRKIKSPQLTAKKLIRINLFFLEPLVLFWTIWGLKLTADVAVLPVAGIFSVFTGFLIGKAALKFLKLEGITADSYLISSTLANQGMTLGGLICYIVAGEQGLGLATIYVVYYLPFVFTFIFPFAKYSSMKHRMEIEEQPRFSFKNFREFFFNFQNLPLAGILIALALQFMHVARPLIFFPLDYILFTAISLYYLTLGINFQVGHITSGKKEQAALALSKFIILPAITFAALRFIELDPAVKTVIQVQSFMPAAIYSVISSILFDLDSKLTSGLFVVNSLIFLAVVLPVLMMLKGALL